MTTPSQSAPSITLRPARKLAVTALIIGVIALLTAAVPVLGAVLGIASIIFGAVALKKRQPKGFSLTGLILGILATIVSIVVTITLVVTAGDIFSALEDMSFDTKSVRGQEEPESDDDLVVEDTGEESSPDTVERIPWDAFDTADAPLSRHAGTKEDPHPLGSRFMVDDKWEVVINMVNRDALRQVLALAPENALPAQGERYVLLNMTMKNLIDEPVRVGDLGVQYDTPKQLYPAGRNGKMLTPEPALFTDNDLQITGSYTGYVAFRTKDVDGEFVRLSGWATTERVFVAVE